jgi:hypothetical protein
VRDLFGEVPVSTDELELWCRAVAGLGATSPRFRAYVRDYRVAEKIAAAKLAGDFDAEALELEAARRGGEFSGRAYSARPAAASAGAATAASMLL